MEGVRRADPLADRRYLDHLLPVPVPVDPAARLRTHHGHSGLIAVVADHGPGAVLPARPHVALRPQPRVHLCQHHRDRVEQDSVSQSAVATRSV